MSRARFGFAAHPDALTDLRDVPGRIRDLALLHLQHLVHGTEPPAPLHGTLSGCHKVYLDPAAQWRMVIQYRKAPPGALHPRDIHLLAVGARQDHTVYDAALQRLHALRTATTAAPGPHGQRAQAAHSRSPRPPTLPGSVAPQPQRPAAPPTPGRDRPARPSARC